MKRFTLLAAALLFCGFSMNAQSSCATAQALTVANNASSMVTVAPLAGDPTPIPISCVTATDGTTNDQNGAWYSYTSTQDIVVTVTTDLASNGTPNETGGNPDASFYYPTVEIFTGTCSSLSVTTCDFGSVGDGNAEVTFFAKSGVTYYIVFNDLLAQLGAGTTTAFDFEISTDDTNVPTTPGVATSPTPADDATGVVIDESDSDSDGNPDNVVSFSWSAPAGSTVTNYQFFLSDSIPPTSLADMESLGFTANTSVNITNMSHDTEFFWAIRPVNAFPGNSPDDSQIVVWSFTTEDTAGIKDNQLAGVSFYPNPVVNELNIDMPSSVELESATIHNLLGKQTKVSISENNTINMSQMAAGVYILKLETNQGTMTKKVIKQ